MKVIGLFLYPNRALNCFVSCLRRGWVYDFYIEIGNVKKDIARINRAFQYKMKLVLIEEEYGIYDEKKDLMIGFRTSIPWQIKKIYDEVSDEIDRLEAGGRIID